MSKIIDFYRGHETTDGDHLSHILGLWDDMEWETGHSFIQWLFPLKDPSQFNPDAPLLTEGDIVFFKSDPILANKLRASFRRFLKFVGLEYNEEEKVVPGRSWNNRKGVWSHFNHNWLRVTRVLSCLHTLGLQKEADAFFECLRQMYQDDIGIGSDSLQFWTEAVKGVPFSRKLA